jgi:hypothetical protein
MVLQKVELCALPIVLIVVVVGIVEQWAPSYQLTAVVPDPIPVESEQRDSPYSVYGGLRKEGVKEEAYLEGRRYSLKLLTSPRVGKRGMGECFGERKQREGEIGQSHDIT